MGGRAEREREREREKEKGKTRLLNVTRIASVGNSTVLQAEKQDLLGGIFFNRVSANVA